MDDLTAFVRARLDEDEARAEAARRVQTGWYLACDDDTVTIDALREHIGHCSPARRLREVEAGRKLIGIHRRFFGSYLDGDGIERGTDECEECAPAGTPDNWPCRTLRVLAAVWGDHPGYRPEWKP